MRKTISFIVTILESVFVTSICIAISYNLKVEPIILLSCVIGYYVAAKNSARSKLDE